DVLTLFPDMITPVLGQSMLKRAQDKGLLEVRIRNLRDYTLDRHKVADDVPYGGGAGMGMEAEPILRAVGTIKAGDALAGERNPACSFHLHRVGPLPRSTRRISRPRLDGS